MSQVPSVQAATALIRRLVGLGVSDVALSPGSRSAPLAYVLEAAERAGAIRLHVRPHEASAAFVALGAARASGHPAVVVTTSGTAVGHLLPATMEAHHSEVPLLLVTADRPSALRGTWANQTSDRQHRALAPFVRHSLDLESADLAHWDGAATTAMAAAMTTPRGPVHINTCFDDPLTPEGALEWTTTGGGQPVSACGPDPVTPAVVPGGDRTVVIAGDGAGARARELAMAAGWPLLAEPSSGARVPPSVPVYRLLLDTILGQQIRRVVVVGRPTLSRPVARLIGCDDVEVVHVVEHDDVPGPPGRSTRRVLAPAGASLRAERADEPDWMGLWAQAGALGLDAARDVVSSWPRLNGPAVAHALAAATRQSDALLLAASNPIRDMDLMATGFAPGTVVLANRGLSGIDGTLSTAIGLAAAGGRPTRAFVGDLAFLHDSAGLAVPAAERERMSLQIVVLDDDGGGIFGLLEHRDHPGPFERIFGTPHGTDVAALCEAHRVPCVHVDAISALNQVLADVPRGISVVHVPADRGDLDALHRAVRSSVSAAVASLVGRP